ncbi:cysteine-rich receptor-like protein kinase 10 [Oryza brachyantha]|uniref:Gnk2-homologous domain-containing protein n=1 Tax=Oryza brachyantha TaxID=4533 RepID=J3MLM2_ORYBR|nr:cysteine-rich receptor-like protein kinase 10 [Oryza brachyantha]XP_040382141.1 cysteine-rich receptor-like protein kinase 10 [Oryza brachyantha]XP_040382142.1 cysteine-rich receptor-like protein kinase 10 [Oryza brachyantha]
MPRAAAALLLTVLALVAPPLSAAATDALDDDDDHRSAFHACGNQGQYAPNSSYEANLRYLAGTLPAKVNGSSSSFASVLAGERPDEISAYGFCNSSSGCAACLATAFRHAQLVCPYSRRAMADLRACRVSYHNVHRREQVVRVVPAVAIFGDRMSSRWLEILVDDFPMMLLLQVMGIACVLFMFLQEWRASRKGAASANLLP